MLVSLRLVYIVIGLVICVIFLNVLLGRKAESIHANESTTHWQQTTSAIRQVIQEDISSIINVSKFAPQLDSTVNHEEEKEESHQASPIVKATVQDEGSHAGQLHEKLKPALKIDKNEKDTVTKADETIKPRKSTTKSKIRPASSPQPAKGFDLTGLILCDPHIQELLDKPVLSEGEVAWCKHALDPHGGKVIVGKSWGNLKTREDRNKFEKLNCNTVGTSGKNPSCNDAWGDSHIKKWRQTIAQQFECHGQQNGNSTTSQVNCYKNDLNDQYCSITHAMIDFRKMSNQPKPGSIPSRKFESDFISFSCSDEQQQGGGDTARVKSGSGGSGGLEAFQLEEFKFNYLISPSSIPQQCDQIIPGTTFLYSHDNIRNLCHTWNDVMNIWLMLWLEQVADHSKDSINLLTIDAMKLYNNFHDLVNEFFVPYQFHFHHIYRGLDFETKKICFEKLVLQPLPSRGFVWENWHQDLPCSFKGPSSLFQRWNIQIRQSFGLLSPTPKSVTTTTTGNQAQNQDQDILQILLIVRREKQNDWGSYRTSRLFLNEEEMIRGLKRKLQDSSKYRFIVKDMASVPDFKEQVKLLAETSIVIAMHGAGLVQTMYMSIGTKNCCGVIEMFPKGEFSPVRGYANMMRKMGLHYDRIDISDRDSRADGAIVPTSTLVDKLDSMISKVTKESSCILPIVGSDPYLMNE
jgi:hypothetical protein